MAEALATTASVIAVIQITGKLVILGYEYIGGVKDASKDLRHLMDELYSLTKVLLDLQDFVRDARNVHSAVLQMLDGQNGPLSGCMVELRRLQLKMEPKTGWRAKMKSLMWPLNEKDTMKHIQQLERHKTLFVLAITKDQLAQSTIIEGYAQDINRIVHELQAESSTQRDLSTAIEGYARDTNIVVHSIQTESTTQASQMQEVEAHKKRETVLSWISPGDFDNKHLEISGKRKSNTGKWLLRDTGFQSWIEGQQNFQLLWGHGIPGAGKTFLSSMVIDHLEERAPTENYGVAHVYFDYMDQDRQKPIVILANLVKKLAYKKPSLPAELERLYDTLQPQNKRPGFAELYTALLKTSKAFNRVFLVFDALDECNQDNQRRELLPLFHQLATHGTGINVFVTSRPHPEDIQTSLHGAAKIELSAKAEDISIYIQERIEENPRSKRLVGQACKGRIISELVDCAKGMFLLVRFHIDYLCQQTTARQILVELERLKNSSTGERPLDPTYDRAMENVRKQPENCTELAFRVLSWLVKAKRTLTFNELREAVSIEPNRYELDGLDQLVDKATLLDVCASLVTLDEETNTVRLAHYTVQEYLLRNCIPPDADFRAAMACTTYLAFGGFAQQSPCTPKNFMGVRPQPRPFLRYAVSYFLTHIEACDEATTTDIFLKFLKNPYSINFYLQEMRHLNPWNYSFSQIQSPLHIASSIGHCSAVRLLLESGVDLSAQDSYKMTALHLTVKKGYIEVVRLLLENGADIEARDSSGKTALRWAVGRGDNRITKLLLENGADIEARDDCGEATLHWAVESGNNEITKLLLENGADIEARDDCGETALHWAVGSGNNKIIKLLLENGADIEARNNCGETALHWAVERGKNETIKLLPENGADIKAQDNSGETALHSAAKWGEIRTVKPLLESGADIEARDNRDETALQLAASLGNTWTVKLLETELLKIARVGPGTIEKANLVSRPLFGNGSKRPGPDEDDDHGAKRPRTGCIDKETVLLEGMDTSA